MSLAFWEARGPPAAASLSLSPTPPPVTGTQMPASPTPMGQNVQADTYTYRGQSTGNPGQV